MASPPDSQCSSARVDDGAVFSSESESESESESGSGSGSVTLTRLFRFLPDVWLGC